MRIFPQEKFEIQMYGNAISSILGIKMNAVSIQTEGGRYLAFIKTLHFTHFSSLIPTICSILGHVAIETIGDKSQGSTNLRSGPILAVLTLFTKRKRKWSLLSRFSQQATGKSASHYVIFFRGIHCHGMCSRLKTNAPSPVGHWSSSKGLSGTENLSYYIFFYLS